jgi:penicillin-binding protein 1C
LKIASRRPWGALTFVFFAALIAAGGKLADPALKKGMSWSGGFYDDHGQLLRVTLSKDEKYRVWTDINQFDPQFVEAVLAKEDGYFKYHWGVNPAALARAAWITYGGHGRRIGGSTLTMQLARLRYGIKSKSVFGKLKQIAAAVWIETFCGKKEILETYLNLLPYGSNVEGAGTASLVYFHKPPSKLTLTEALTLAVVPQSPTQRSLEKGKESDRLIQERKMLFEKLAKVHPEYKTEEFEMDSPIELTSTGKLPFLAPHFVNELVEKEALSGFVTTTLNLPLQKLVEKSSIGIRWKSRRLWAPPIFLTITFRGKSASLIQKGRPARL